MPIDFHQGVVVLHLIGAVMGAGGASASAMIFFRSISDLKITKEELAFLAGASRMVWIGFVILLLSGIYLAWASWDLLSTSPKFWAKQTIVGILFVNGIFLNLRLLPRFICHADQHLASSAEFMRYRHEVFISGAISGVSWYSALILGALRGIDVSYGEIMTFYGLVLVCAIAVGLLIGHRLFEKVGQ